MNVLCGTHDTRIQLFKSFIDIVEVSLRRHDQYSWGVR